MNLYKSLEKLNLLKESNSPSNNATEIPGGIHKEYVHSFHNIKYCEVYPTNRNELGGVNFKCQLTGQIRDIDEYLDLLEILNVLTEKDTICIDIDSPGGYICSGVIISTFIYNCKGKVITNAVGLCASAGSLVWSAGHECRVQPLATLMWHMSLHSDYGNSIAIGNEADIQITYVKDQLLSKSVERGHLLQNEFDKITSDPSYICWISSTEMLNRIKNKNDINLKQDDTAPTIEEKVENSTIEEDVTPTAANENFFSVRSLKTANKDLDRE